jgi:3,4-dihydroxy 2-butanone 4-phosphate synthase/GTP cyclohydrolase II
MTAVTEVVVGAAIEADQRRRLSLDSIERAISEIRIGRPVLVLDRDHPDSPGELIFSAHHARTELVSFAVRHTSGYLCVALPDIEADRLGLPTMSSAGTGETAFAVTVDAAQGITTGISAADRGHTIRLLAQAQTTPAELTRPGHVVPIRALPDGVLQRAAQAEAASDLPRLAGLAPVGVLAEVVSRHDPLTMATGSELREFADEFGLALVTVDQLVAYRRRVERRSTRRLAAALRQLADVLDPTK